MSTLKANAILDASGGSTATINGVAVTSDNYIGMRNRIINGDMRIDQRNAGASVTGNNAVYTLDRWRCTVSQSSKFTVQQSSTAPTGFINSLLVTSSSAYSIAAGDYFNLQQRIEGLNIADLAWGSASAKTVTLSFWVRSSLTGTFGGALNNNDYSRSYPFSYTISAANTWEQKSITIAGDTTGTWLTNNGNGIILTLSLGIGTTYAGTAGAWASGDYEGVTGQTNIVATNAATWYITGVQLEVGSVATPFERRPYGTELMLCQRYYEKTFLGLVQSTRYADTYSTGYWSVEKRASPTLSISIGTGSGATVGVASGNATKAFYQTAANSATSGSTVTGEIEL